MKNGFRKTALLIALAAAVFTCSFASCGEKVSSSGNVVDKADDGEQVTITVPTGTALASAVEDMARKYKKQNGDTINVEKVSSSEYGDYIYTNFAGGSGSDIVFFDTETTGDTHGVYQYITSNWLEDLTPYLESDKNYKAENYYENIIDGGHVGQYQMVFPLTFSVPLFYTLSPASTELGAPDGSETSAEEMYGKIFALEDKVTSGDIKYVFTGGVDTLFAYALAGGFVDLASKELNFSQSAKLGLKLVYDNYMTSAQQATLRAQSGDGTWGGGGINYMNDGVAAMSAQTSSYMNTIFMALGMTDYDDQTLNAFAIPDAEESEKHTALITSCVALSKNSAHKTRAYEFLSYCITNDDFLNALGGNRYFGGGMSTKRSVLDNSVISNGNGGMYDGIVENFGEKAAQKVFNTEWQNTLKTLLIENVKNPVVVDNYIATELSKAVANKQLGDIGVDALANQLEVVVTEYLGY